MNGRFGLFFFFFFFVLFSFRVISFVFSFMEQMTGSWFFIFWRLGCLTCHSLLFDPSLTFVSTGLPFFWIQPEDTLILMSNSCRPKYGM